MVNDAIRVFRPLEEVIPAGHDGPPPITNTVLVRLAPTASLILPAGVGPWVEGRDDGGDDVVSPPLGASTTKALW